MSKRETAEKKMVLPGDVIASPEEFMPGKNTYEQEDSVRATLPGQVEKDLSKREVAVRAAVRPKALAVGDVVVGQVEAAMSSTAGVRITFVNGRQTLGGFPGTIFTRGERGGRGVRRTYVKLGDVVRAKVSSTLNGMNQLSIEEPHLGVLATLCSVCGTPLTKDGRAPTCQVCGSVEERKFADDFGSPDIRP